jgi:exopolysaccharide biosynthesis polyprenyl glycosylphosphotransferase
MAARLVMGAVVVLALLPVLVFLANAAPGLPGLALTTRMVPLAAWGFTMVLLLAWRLLWAHHARRDPSLRRRVLVLGAGHSGHVVVNEMLRQGDVYDVVGFVDDDPAKAGTAYAGVPVLGTHADLPDIAAAHEVDTVVLCISPEVRGPVFGTLVDLGAEGPEVVAMPLFYEQITGRVAVEHDGAQWYVSVPVEPMRYGLGGRLAKRALDVAGGLVLALLLLAVLPFVALAIRLDSPGPVFYRQWRLGYAARRYRVVKFRSMVHDAEAEGAQWAALGDARVTRVGRFLRRTRLDELPQALNVLRGEMSLVGPRPERPEFEEALQAQIPFYRARLAARPGLTGWAQVRYGYTATVEDALVKLQYDLYYLRHRTFAFDLYVIARTLPVLLRMQGR